MGYEVDLRLLQNAASSKIYFHLRNCSIKLPEKNPLIFLFFLEAWRGRWEEDCPFTLPSVIEAHVQNWFLWRILSFYRGSSCNRFSEDRDNLIPKVVRLFFFLEKEKRDGLFA